MTLELRKQSNAFMCSFLLGVFGSALILIILMPATVSAGWFTREKVIDIRKNLPSGGKATMNAKYSDYAYDYGDTAKGFPDIEVFVICAACGKSSVLERMPVFPPISIRASVPGLPVDDGTKKILPAQGSPHAGNETSPAEKVDLVPEGTKEQRMSPVPGEKNKTPCILTTVYFKLDSNVIRDAEMKKIRNDVVNQLGKRDMKLSVKGYTCELGTKQYNDKLALRRAKAVAKVLEEAGIHLTEVSGEWKCCYVSNQLSRNRRSEVVVQPESTNAADLRCQDSAAK